MQEPAARSALLLTPVYVWQLDGLEKVGALASCRAAENAAREQAEKSPERELLFRKASNRRDLSGWAPPSVLDILAPLSSNQVVSEAASILRSREPAPHQPALQRSDSDLVYARASTAPPALLEVGGCCPAAPRHLLRSLTPGASPLQALVRVCDSLSGEDPAAFEPLEYLSDLAHALLSGAEAERQVGPAGAELHQERNHRRETRL